MPDGCRFSRSVFRSPGRLRPLRAKWSLGKVTSHDFLGGRRETASQFLKRLARFSKVSGRLTYVRAGGASRPGVGKQPSKIFQWKQTGSKEP